MIIDTATLTTDAVHRATKAISPHSNRVRFLDADNRVIGDETDWAPEMATEVYMVKLACSEGFHTVALDFDAKHVGAERAELDSQRAVEVLAFAGVSAVRAASGPDGGR